MTSDNELENLCQNIRRTRERDRLSITQMARILGISPRTLKKLEAGILPPSAGVDIIFRLAGYCGKKPCEVFLPFP